MAFKRLVLIVAISATLPATPRAGAAIVVDPGGGGDFDNIPEAAFHAGADDTVLVLPGTYTVTAAGTYPWPIPLTGDSPTFVGQAGASMTTIEGDGTLAAFSVAAGVTDAALSAHGFRFLALQQTVDWAHPSYPGGPFRFTDNIIDSAPNSYAALNAGDGAGGLIARNVFTGTGSVGIRLGFGGDFGGVVEDNEVSGYFESGIEGAGAGVVLRGNHVHDGVNCGIVAYGPLTAYDNLVENNGFAGFMLDGTACLESNVIRGNGVGITWPGSLFDTPDGHVRMNDIYDNSTNIAVPLILGYSVVFDATMNWWGTNDPEQIADGIYDCNDEWGGECCVDFTAWCTAPIPECNPTPSEGATWGTIKALYR